MNEKLTVEEWDQEIASSGGLGDADYTHYLALMREFAVLNQKMDVIIAAARKGLDEGRANCPVCLTEFDDSAEPMAALVLTDDEIVQFDKDCNGVCPWCRAWPCRCALEKEIVALRESRDWWRNQYNNIAANRLSDLKDKENG